jgi:hypothetical protein
MLFNYSPQPLQLPVTQSWSVSIIMQVMEGHSLHIDSTQSLCLSWYVQQYSANDESVLTPLIR